MQIIPTIKKTARTLPKIIENNHKDGTMKYKIRLPETPKVPIHKNIIPSFFNKLAPFSMMSLFLLRFSIYIFIHYFSFALITQVVRFKNFWKFMIYEMVQFLHNSQTYLSPSFIFGYGASFIFFRYCSQYFFSLSSIYPL